jgi:hypothetical protein
LSVLSTGAMRKTLKHYESGQHLREALHWLTGMSGIFHCDVHALRRDYLMESCLQQQITTHGTLCVPDATVDNLQFMVNYGDRRTVRITKARTVSPISTRAARPLRCHPP